MDSNGGGARIVGGRISLLLLISHATQSRFVIAASAYLEHLENIWLELLDLQDAAYAILCPALRNALLTCSLGLRPI